MMRLKRVPSGPISMNPTGVADTHPPSPPSYARNSSRSAPTKVKLILLILFALVAGAGTALSPCVLPVLPAILSAGVTGGRRRPLGVVAGLAASFTFATVALVYVIAALGLPNDFARTLAIVTLIAFGALLLIRPLA